ncbi:LysR substrate-binding domain-containing protein [Cellulosimicrobium marinum]|uniref:LysR substrate-binding domain-containing protein n=1 Tax=Cellulosimicrobium marinum TaxID=1638992 RepID=UPI001E286C98|nr:LysR substrate-binding domain-containing protein [Cellulosimicrobium marinum]MCB7137103.1 LysR family transcriptional regulator [Cellulosimicrobium marinum]
MDDDAGAPPEQHDPLVDPPADDPAGRRRFRLAYVPGATPAKWVRTWRERHPDVPLDLVAVEAADAERALRDGEADAAILRLPVDRDVLAAIPLYEETPVVLVPRDHLLAALDPDEPVALDDLADDVLQRPLDDVVAWAGERGAADDAPAPPGLAALERPATTADAVVLVAAGVGVLVAPQSLARLHHRKDVVHRRLDGAPLAPVALAWVADRDDDLVEEMVGIVRGRTVNSSRGRAAAGARSGAGTDAPGDRAASGTRGTGKSGTGGKGSGGRGAGVRGGGSGGAVRGRRPARGAGGRDGGSGSRGKGRRR